MILTMLKISENDHFVDYKVETQEYLKECIIDSNGKKIWSKDVYAYCRLNKSNEIFEIDKVRSDPYLLKQNSREMMHAYCQMLKRLREKEEFPPVIIFASC